MNFKNYSDLSGDIRKNLHVLASSDYDLVVGLPRSGMVPAYIIALSLNLDCTDLMSFIDNRPLKKGYHRQTKTKICLPHEARRILLVDDSIWSGNSLSKDLAAIPIQLRDKVTTLAIYSSKRHRTDVDFYFEYLSTPRLFEWNLFHHNLVSRSCVDIDGVLCVDPTDNENDDGENYRQFLLNAKPLHLPSVKIHSIVTSRLEKFREETQTWLSKHGVEYEHLVMLDLPSKQHRMRLNMYSKFKAQYYRNSNTILFIESDMHQAGEICRLAGKPVYSVPESLMHNPDAVSVIKSNPKGLVEHIPEGVKRYLRPFKQILQRKRIS